MTLFTFPSFEYIGSALQKTNGYKNGKFSVLRYANEELHITLGTDVRGQECFILGSITPPDEQLVSFLLLAHTLKKEGARKVTAILPYLAYARHDKLVAKESLATAWVGALLEQSGIDAVTTLSIHSDEDREYIPVPIDSLSPMDAFAQVIAERDLQTASLVAPDEGAIDRCDALKRAADMPTNVAHFTKRRTKTGVVLSGISGTVTPEVVIVDDMLDTGQTLVACCKKLRALRVRSITIFVTHGIFSGSAWSELWKLGVDHIYCTDSIPPDTIPHDDRIHILPVAAELLHRACPRSLI